MISPRVVPVLLSGFKTPDFFVALLSKVGFKIRLYTRLGIEYCREHPRQLLHELGVRRRRLRHRHLKAKPEAQAAFRAGLEVLLEDWPEEWELVFVDEATVRRQPTLTAQWCLVEAVPEVPMGDVYAKGPVDGAVAPLPGQTHYYISPELGKGEFAQFLQHLLVYHPGKRLLVIHDRGGQHKGTPVDAVVREAQGRLVLKPQPAYSPELNPQERIWKWLRRVVTHNHWFATLTAQIEAIRNFFRYLAGVKAQVRRLCSLKTPESYLENSLGRGGRAWFELHLIAQILEASRQPVHQLVALPLIEVVGP